MPDLKQTIQPEVEVDRTLTTSPAQPEQLKSLLVWRAPSRLFKKRDREFFSTLIAIAFLIGVILFFIKEWFAIVVLVAFAFLSYIYSTVEPEEIDYEITNRGINVHGTSYFWEEMGRFWFDEKMKQQVLYIERPVAFPYRLVILLGKQDPKKITEILTKYLLQEQPEKTWTEKAGSWLSEKVPLEKEN